MKLLNMPLLSNPLNWIVVGIMATVWLFAFHAMMQGFQGMQGDASNAAP